MLLEPRKSALFQRDVQNPVPVRRESSATLPAGVSTACAATTFVLAPPFILADAQVDEIVGKLGRTLDRAVAAAKSAK